MKFLTVVLALVAFALSGGELAAQTPPPAPPAAGMGEAAKAMIGTWEFVNADRDKRCSVSFRADTGPGGTKVEFDRGCPAHYPFIRDVVAWSLNDGDFLRLLDARGRAVLEFSEVESGVFEAPRPGEGILFIQAASAAGPEPRGAESMLGDWTLQRAGKAICALTLTSTAAGADLALRLRQPCDALVTRFAPTTWQMERGELVLKSARGQSWRFEEGEEQAWKRIPESADAITLVRK